MIIGGKVIDVSKYLEDHPGGEEVLLDRVGQDATEDFEDVGHSQDARKQLATFEVGELPPSERKSAKAASGGGGGGMGVMALVPVLLAAAQIARGLAPNCGGCFDWKTSFCKTHPANLLPEVLLVVLGQHHVSSPASNYFFSCGS